MSLQQKSILELDVVDIDLKEDYSLGTDIECHQNDNLILKFCLRDYGELVDLTNWNVELRVKRADGNDYIQTNTGIVKDSNGNLTINTTDQMTCIGGNAKGELRLWNTQYNQKTGRVLYIKVIPSTLSPNNEVSESTITILNHLDLSLDMANDVMDELKETIEDGEEEIAAKAQSKGESEIIIAKHRNGSVGTVKLLFQGNITKFKNPIKTDAF